jgi:hypothetical protein
MYISARYRICILAHQAAGAPGVSKRRAKGKKEIFNQDRQALKALKDKRDRE